MTTKQWLGGIVVLAVVAVIAAAAGGVADTAQENFHPVWQEGE